VCTKPGRLSNLVAGTRVESGNSLQGLSNKGLSVGAAPGCSRQFQVCIWY